MHNTLLRDFLLHLFQTVIIKRRSVRELRIKKNPMNIQMICTE